MLTGNRARLLVLASALAIASVATIACGGGSVIDTPQTQVEVTSKSGLKISASIAAVSLGESYSGSNVQLAFIANEAVNPAAIEIVSVSLIDSSTGAVADTLKSSEPRVWNGSSYVAWNQNVTPGGDLKASYSLSTPNWASIDSGFGPGGSSRYGSRSYSIPFKLRVTMRIDGTEVVLESAELHREPVMVT